MEPVNIVFAVLLFCVVMGLLNAGRGRRRYRELEHQLARLQHAAQAPQAPPPALPGASREQVEDLEARVRVLERIVTDRGLNLAAEIEALRDGRPARASEEEGSL